MTRVGSQRHKEKKYLHKTGIVRVTLWGRLRNHCYSRHSIIQCSLPGNIEVINTLRTGDADLRF